MTESNECDVPGPGAYNVNTSLIFTSLATVFKGEPRPDMGAKGAEKIPAPNAYSRDAKSVILKSAPSFGFGSQKQRPQSHMTRGVPGPGTYRLKDLVGSDAKATTLKQKLAETKTSNFFVPGPGTYNARYELALAASPKWKLGSSASRNDEAK